MINFRGYNLHFSRSLELVDEILKEKNLGAHINSISYFDPQLLKHCVNTSLLSLDLALENLYPEKEVKLLGCSALLHDIGKLEIPPSILNKRSSLTSGEKEIVDEHVRVGIIKLNGFNHDLLSVLGYHHEFQSNPYPRKMAGMGVDGVDRRKTSLSPLGQILAVSDLFDALRSPRPYKEAISTERAKEIMFEQYTGNTRYVHQIILR